MAKDLTWRKQTAIPCLQTLPPPSYGIKPLEYCLWLLQNIRALCKPQSGKCLWLVNCHEHLRTELYRGTGTIKKDIPSMISSAPCYCRFRWNPKIECHARSAWNQTYWNSTNYRHNISLKIGFAMSYSRDHPYKGWLEMRAISPCY